VADMSRGALDMLCREIHDTMSDEARLKDSLSCLGSAGTSPKDADIVLRSGCFGQGGSYGAPGYPTPSFAELRDGLDSDEAGRLVDFYRQELQTARNSFPNLFRE